MRDYDPEYIRPIREKIPFTDLSGWTWFALPNGEIRDNADDELYDQSYGRLSIESYLKQDHKYADEADLLYPVYIGDKPHELTFDEYGQSAENWFVGGYSAEAPSMPDWIKKYVGREITDSNRAMIQAEAYEEHAKAVEFAMQMGEPVTQDVLKDHGGLQRLYGGGPQFARRRTRRRKPPEVLDRFDLEPPTRLERFRMYWVDSLSRLERFEKRAYEKGLRLAQAESPTMAARLVPGKTTYKQELLDTNYIAPIFGVLADAGIKIPQFDDYLILRTTKESNADLREKREQAIANRQQARILTRRSEEPIDRTLPEDVKEDLRKQRKADKKEAQRLRREADRIDPGENPKSFYTDEEAEAKLAVIDKNPQLRKALDEAGRLIDEMNKATRKQLLDSSLISQEQHDLWEEKFEHYVPFRSDPDGSSWVEMNAGTSGYSVRGPEARVRRGTTRKPQPFLFSVRQAGRAIARGEKNQVGVRAYNFFQKANMIESVEDVEPDQSAPDLSGTAKFYLKINGEQKVVTLKDEYLARALKNMGPGRKGDPGALDKLVRLASWITRKRANFNTQLNPDFLFANPIRDQIEAQLKVGELRERGFRLGRTSLLVDTGRFAKHIAGKPTKGTTESGPLGDYYRRFGEAGGMIRLGDMQDYQEDMAALEAKLERMSKSPSKFTGMAQLQTALDALSRWNRAAELGVRLSVFKQLVDGGATDAQAAAAARDITVDFNRRGQGTAAINSMYMFFNATMQGTDRNLRALKTKAGRRMAGALMVAGYIHSLTQSLGSDEDEDGRLEWDNEPWYNKARNLAFGYGASKIFKLPLPYFWSLPFLAGQLLDSLTRGVMTPDEASTYLAAATLNDLTPLEFGSDRDTFVNKRTLTQLLPTPLSTASDLIVNLDYRGRPIMRERFPGEKTPARERGTGRPEEMLSGLSQSVVDFVAKMTGQDPMSAPGNIGDWNPDAVEYVITDTFGGLGSSVLRGGKIVEAIFSDEKEAKLGDYPVSRRFFGHAAVGGVSANYFALKEHIERLESRYRAGDKETRAWLKEQEPTAYKSMQALKTAEKRRKYLLNKRDAAKTSEDKKAAEDALEAHLGKFVSRFDEVEAKR